jgi:hypothetical protein
MNYTRPHRTLGESRRGHEVNRNVVGQYEYEREHGRTPHVAQGGAGAECARAHQA